MRRFAFAALTLAALATPATAREAKHAAAIEAKHVAAISTPAPPHVAVSVATSWTSLVSGHAYIHARVTMVADRDLDVRSGDFVARVPSSAGFARYLTSIYGPAPLAQPTSMYGTQTAAPKPTVKSDEDFGAIGTVALTSGKPATIVITFDGGSATSPSPTNDAMSIVYRGAR